MTREDKFCLKPTAAYSANKLTIPSTFCKLFQLHVVCVCVCVCARVRACVCDAGLAVRLLVCRFELFVIVVFRQLVVSQLRC